MDVLFSAQKTAVHCIRVFIVLSVLGVNGLNPAGCRFAR